MKQLTITIDYIEGQMHEKQHLGEELEWIRDEVEMGRKSGYNDYINSVTGEAEIVTTYTIKEYPDGK